jgi:hypothetical protein
MSVRVIKAGTIEFLTKPFRDQELHRARSIESRAGPGTGRFAAAILCDVVKIAQTSSSKPSNIQSKRTLSLSHMLGANRKSATLAAQSLQTAGLIGYQRGKIRVVDRAGLEQASCECYAIVKERFDAFPTPPSTAVQGDTKGRRER